MPRPKRPRGHAVVDGSDPYRTFIARGRATLIDEGADEHIDALSLKYLGQPNYPMHRPGSSSRSR